MKLPLLFLTSTAFLAACSADGDDVGANDSDVTVHPKGDSTLGTFELVVPADLATGDHRLFVTMSPAAGSTAVESPDTSTLSTGGSIRIVPGTYCLNVYASASGHGSNLSTTDCSITVTGGGTRTYRLARVHLQADPVTALLTQRGRTGGISAVAVTGDSVTGEIGADTIDLPSAKTRLTTNALWSGTKPAALADAWPAVDTDVPEGGEITLGIPSGDHIIKIGSGLEPVTLPDAVAGGGMHWRWDNGPAYAASFATAKNVDALHWEDFKFFDGEPGTIVFELGGLENKMTLAPGPKAAYGYAIEVADVVDTDDAGVQTTISGLVSVYRASDNRLLTWRDSNNRTVSSFWTNHSVHVWGWEKYRVEVTYSKNGISKTYTEVVDLH